jgi:hypothetical protein
MFLLISCNNSPEKQKDTQDTVTIDNTKVNVNNDTVPPVKTGGDEDEHGCKPSAGYTWSKIKQQCIRPFEMGVKMDPKDPSLDKTTAAFLVFSDDRVRVEIFLPTQKNSVVIRKTSAAAEPEKWANGPLTLFLDKGVYTLDDEGKILYQGNTK